MWFWKLYEKDAERRWVKSYQIINLWNKMKIIKNYTDMDCSVSSVWADSFDWAALSSQGEIVSNTQDKVCR